MLQSRNTTMNVPKARSLYIVNRRKHIIYKHLFGEGINIIVVNSE